MNKLISKKLLKITWSEKIYISISLLLISITIVISPFIIRTLVDAVAPTGDYQAILFMSSWLIVLELFSSIVGLLLNRLLDKKSYLFVKNSRRILFRKLFNQRVEFNTEAFIYFVTDQLRLLAQQIFRFRILRYGDLLVLLLLTYGALMLTPFAGLLILIVFMINLIAQVVIKTLKNSFGSVIFDRIKIEKSLLMSDISYLDQTIDEKKQDLLLKSLEGRYESIDQLTYENYKIRTYSENISRTIKAFSVVILIFFSLVLNQKSDWSMGQLWAIMIFLYRAFSPAEKVSEWIVYGTKLEESLETWRQWVDGKQLTKKNKTPWKGAIQHFFENEINNGLTFLQCYYPNQEKEAIIEAIRITRDYKTSDIENIYIIPSIEWKNRIEELSNKLDSSSKKTIFVITDIQNKEQILDLSRFKHPQAITIALTDKGSCLSLDCPIYYFHTLNYYYTNLTLKNITVETIDNWINVYSSQSIIFKNFFETIQHCCESHNPYLLVVLKDVSLNIDEVHSSLRKNDSLITVNDDTLVLGFYHCSQVQIDKVLSRVLGKAYPVPIYDMIEFKKGITSKDVSLNKVKIFEYFRNYKKLR